METMMALKLVVVKMMMKLKNMLVIVMKIVM
jgi:hypothetical protein